MKPKSPFQLPGFVRVPLNVAAPMPVRSAGEAGIEADVSRYFFKSGVNHERIFETKRRWGGIDVFVQVPSMNGVNTLERAAVGVFAINGNVRTLVASGYLTPDLSRSVVPDTSFRIASVRGVMAERFEVDFFYDATLAAGVQVPVYFSYAASDSAFSDSPDDTVGIVRGTVDEPMTLDFQISYEAPPWGIELAGVHLTGIAAARFLHFHDVDTAAATGLAPLLSIPFGVGTFINEWRPLFRARRFRDFLTAVISTTADVTTPTAGADALWNLYFR